MREVWLELRRLVREGETGALVTVVRTEGSAYQREGTKMLFLGSGATVGTISGGCVEADLYERCRAAVERDEPTLITYAAGGMMDEVFGLASGCQGTIELLVEPFSTWRAGRTTKLLDEICRKAADGTHFAVVTLFRREQRLVLPLERLLVDEGGLAAGTFGDRPLEVEAIAAARQALPERRWASRNLELGSRERRVEVLVDVTVPAARLFVFGAGDDARPLVRIAHEIGIEVTVVDWRSELATPERFPEAHRVLCARPEQFPGTASLAGKPAIVLMSHNYVADRAALSRIATCAEPIGYLGVLGPRSRTQRLLRELETAAEKLAPIHTPAGLDLGADTPAEIALAIVAEILAAAKQRSGGPLTAVVAPPRRSE